MTWLPGGTYVFEHKADPATFTGGPTTPTPGTDNDHVTTTGGGTLDLLAVLIGPGEKKYLIAHQAMRPRHGIGDHRRIGVPEMRLRIDVVNRCGDVEAIHDCVVGDEYCPP